VVPASAFDCVSFFNHFKPVSAFHWLASLSFLDLSRDFAAVEDSFPSVKAWLGLLTEDRLKDGTPFQPRCLLRHPSDDSGWFPPTIGPSAVI
jgi:hypothetical protein